MSPRTISQESQKSRRLLLFLLGLALLLSLLGRSHARPLGSAAHFDGPQLATSL